MCRREILRMQSGEADEDIARDREQEAEEQREREEAEQRTARKRSRLFWQIFSGNILVNRSVAENYRYFAAIAVMCFVSIVVMFTSLAADMKYSRMEREVQLLQRAVDTPSGAALPAYDPCRHLGGVGAPRHRPSGSAPPEGRGRGVTVRYGGGR